MVKVPKATIYDCKRCKKEWLQRILAVYDSSGLKIKSVRASPEPQNCTKCKSPSWNVSRS